MQDKFETIPILSPEECQRVYESVISLKEFWSCRRPPVPFYTIGAASYIDSGGYFASEKTRNIKGYKALAAKINPLLKQHLDWVYPKIFKVVQEKTGHPVALEESMALPGFHIFQAPESKELTELLAKTPVHFDVQYSDLDWNYDDIDYDHLISFTLAIRMPKAGSGITYWDANYNDYKDVPIPQIARQTKSHYLPYKEGELLLHDGLTLHQIKPMHNPLPGDERITLQGHCLLCDGVLRVFW